MENQKTNFEITVEEVRKAVTGSKIVEQAGNTGTSWFQGKKRLVKVLNSKRGLTIEINVTLPKALEELDGMKKISAVEAHKKHLGTMKYMYKAPDTKQVSKIIKAAVTQFNKDLAATEAKEQQPEQKAQ